MDLLRGWYSEKMMWVMSAILVLAIMISLIINMRPYILLPILVIGISAFLASRGQYFDNNYKHIFWLDLVYSGLFLFWVPTAIFMVLPNMPSGNVFGYILFIVGAFGALLFMASSIFAGRTDEY